MKIEIEATLENRTVTNKFSDPNIISEMKPYPWYIRKLYQTRYINFYHLTAPHHPTTPETLHIQILKNFSMTFNLVAYGV